MIGCDNYFDLDDHHRFFVDLPIAVCGNSCAMVQDTRFGKYFDVVGDRSKHFGLFDGCGDSPAPAADDCGCDGGSCCC